MGPVTETPWMLQHANHKMALFYGCYTLFITLLTFSRVEGANVEYLRNCPALKDPSQALQLPKVYIMRLPNQTQLPVYHSGFGMKYGDNLYRTDQWGDCRTIDNRLSQRPWYLVDNMEDADIIFPALCHKQTFESRFHGRRLMAHFEHELTMLDIPDRIWKTKKVFYVFGKTYHQRASLEQVVHKLVKFAHNHRVACPSWKRGQNEVEYTHMSFDCRGKTLPQDFIYQVPYPSDFQWLDDGGPGPANLQFFHNKRGSLVSFVGGTHHKGKYQYFRDLREMLFDQCANHTKCNVIHFGEQDRTSKFYEIHEDWSNIVETVYRNATFCLQPWGDMASRKGIFDSLLAGCIPVVFERFAIGNLAPAFVNDVKKISLQLNPSDVERKGLISILEGISDNRVEWYQENIRKIVRRWQYTRRPKAAPKTGEDADLLDWMLQVVQCTDVHNSTVGYA